MHSVATGNIIFAVLLTDKYSITEIRLWYWKLQHATKSICSLCSFARICGPRSCCTWLDQRAERVGTTECSLWEKQHGGMASLCRVVFSFHETCILILMGENWSWKGTTRVITLIRESRAIPNTQTDVLLSVRSFILRKGWSLMFRLQALHLAV